MVLFAIVVAILSLSQLASVEFNVSREDVNTQLLGENLGGMFEIDGLPKRKLSTLW